MAHLIFADGGAANEINPEGEFFTLKELQDLVGGYIERVVYSARPGVEAGVMIVDEEGLLKQYPPNNSASFLAGQTIVGDVVVVEEVNTPDGAEWK